MRDTRIFLLLVLFCLVACGRPKQESAKQKPPAPARGQERTEERDVGAFEGLVVPGKVKVVVRKGPTTTARLTGPENYLAQLTIRAEKREVAGRSIDVLVLALPARIKLPLPVVELATPEISFVEAGGPAQVELADFSRERLTLSAHLASKITVAPGSYAFFEAETQMAGRILAPQVMAETANLKASGPSRIVIGQVGRLKRTVIDGGKVSYEGSPELLK